jgi:hypothetical protein
MLIWSIVVRLDNFVSNVGGVDCNGEGSGLQDNLILVTGRNVENVVACDGWVGES